MPNPLIVYLAAPEDVTMVKSISPGNRCEFYFLKSVLLPIQANPIIPIPKTSIIVGSVKIDKLNNSKNIS